MWRGLVRPRLRLRLWSQRWFSFQRKATQWNSRRRDPWPNIRRGRRQALSSSKLGSVGSSENLRARCEAQRRTRGGKRRKRRPREKWPKELERGQFESASVRHTVATEKEPLDKDDGVTNLLVDIIVQRFTVHVRPGETDAVDYQQIASGCHDDSRKYDDGVDPRNQGFGSVVGNTKGNDRDAPECNGRVDSRWDAAHKHELEVQCLINEPERDAKEPEPDADKGAHFEKACHDSGRPWEGGTAGAVPNCRLCQLRPRESPQGAPQTGHLTWCSTRLDSVADA